MSRESYFRVSFVYFSINSENAFVRSRQNWSWLKFIFLEIVSGSMVLARVLSLHTSTQLHVYPPDFATNSPVYLSHQRLCLSFTNIKCVSVRNNSILSIFWVWQLPGTCDVSAPSKISAYHSALAILLVQRLLAYPSNVGGDNGVCLKTRINSTIHQWAWALDSWSLDISMNYFLDLYKCVLEFLSNIWIIKAWSSLYIYSGNEIFLTIVRYF
jgi:hypothetical protein